MALSAASSRLPLANLSRRAQWALLIVLSALLAIGLLALRLPAALLLGPMLAAIVVAGSGGTTRLPLAPFYAAQAVIGCMIADRLPLSLAGEVARNWPIFFAGVFSVIAAATLLGWLLTIWRVLPGASAIWGSSPGAATVMTLMSESYGADMRLVALMQYLRVVCCAVVASLVARLWAVGSGDAAPPIEWLAPAPLAPLLATLLLTAAGLAAGLSRRIPAGAMLVPLALGLVLKGALGLSLALPPLLLAASYAIIGWGVGARFTPEIIRHAARVLPRVLASILALIAICGGFAFILHRIAGVEPLTAFLATSPGGADSVAIIAASSKVDLPFVMAMQMTRFLVVIIAGPFIARFVTSRSGAG
ncbi:MAG: AbrB family transcriptional regulator [Bradyrhizobium sp.]|nr:MAG: AbrB family transcriptional regulator [Bradyrhizobium sp.]